VSAPASNCYYYSGVCGRTKFYPNYCVLRCEHLEWSPEAKRYRCKIGQMRDLSALKLRINRKG